MTDKSPEPISHALLLFYLFERCLAGYMAWHAEPGQSSFDNQFHQHLVARMKKEIDDRLFLEETKEEFDKGFMPTHLAEYLALHIKTKGDEKRPLRGVNASSTRSSLLRLTRQRNSVMHGMKPRLTLDETALAISSVFHELRGPLESRLASLRTERNGVHTQWARLLFLGPEELLWIARGGKLPREDAAAPIEPANLDKGKTQIDFHRTDHHPQLIDGPVVPAGAAFWISNEPRDIDVLRSKAATILRMVNGDRDRDLQIGLAAEGPVDRDSDPFLIPFWSPAPSGQAYVCLFVAS